jgi:sulfur carrier protein ThiS
MPNPEDQAVGATDAPGTTADIEVIEIKIGCVPGTIQTIALNGGRRVSDAIEAAGLNAEGRTIFINGKKSNADAELKTGDNVYLLKALRGNC